MHFSFKFIFGLLNSTEKTIDILFIDLVNYKFAEFISSNSFLRESLIFSIKRIIFKHKVLVVFPSPNECFIFLPICPDYNFQHNVK